MLAARYYVIADASYTYCMWPDIISMGNAVEMSALPVEVFDTDETGFHEEVGRKWYIQQRGNGFYSIHPAYSRNMVLCLLEDGSPVLRHIGAVTNDSWYWRIESSSWGYVIRNYHYTDKTLAFSEPDTAYASLISEAHTSSNGAQNWSVLSAFDPYGLALFDKSDGDLVANSMDYPSTSRVAYMEISHPKTLGQIGMYVEVMVPTGQSTAYNMSFSSSAFSYSTSTYRISATSSTSTTATITKTISGTQYSVSFTISAYSQNNTISVSYDNAYIYRYTNALSRINQITQAVAQKFSATFGKSLTFYSPTPFSSYGDNCQYGYNTNCWCNGDQCFNASATFYEEDGHMHHKNAYNILYYAEPSTTVKQLAFIGHKVCYQGSPHTETSSLLYGLSNESRKYAQVHDQGTLSHETAMALHEVGHLYGAPDHYGGAPNGWTVDQLNALEEVAGLQLFSQNCLYGNYAFGNNNGDVINGLTVCTGCTKVIRGEIILPERPPNDS